MRVIVDLTYDEFGEALAAVRAEHLKAVKLRNQKSPKRWAFVAVVVVIGFVAPRVYLSWMSDPYPQHRPPGYWSTIIMIPVFTLVLLGVVGNIARLWGTPKAVLKQVFTGLLPITIICVSLFFLSSGILFGNAGRRGRFGLTQTPPDWYGTLMPQLPWLAFALLLLVATIRQVKHQQKLAWDTDPRLTQPKTVDLSVYGVSVDETLAQRTYQWPALHRFLETPRLLILCPTELSLEPLPKRCFASPEEISAARALITHQLAAARTTSAFPVRSNTPSQSIAEQPIIHNSPPSP